MRKALPGLVRAPKRIHSGHGGGGRCCLVPWLSTRRDGAEGGEHSGCGSGRGLVVCPIWCSGMCSDFQWIGAGSIPNDYRHTRLSSLSQTPPDFYFILLHGYQQPVHAGVCSVKCVREKNEKDQKVGVHWPEKTHFIAVWFRPG